MIVNLLSKRLKRLAPHGPEPTSPLVLPICKKKMKLFALFGLLLLASVSAQKFGVSKNTISANGVGERALTTTIAVVRLGVEAEDKTAVGAQTKIAAASNKLVAFLKSRNVQKLQTTGVSLNPQFNFRVTPRQLTGYRASNTVSFEVAVDKAGAIIDGAVKNGATNINSVSFKATPAATAAARKQALTDAVKNAEMEARAAATAARRLLGKATTISIGGSFSPGPISAQRSFAAASGGGGGGGAPPTQIIARDQIVRASVSITYVLI